MVSAKYRATNLPVKPVAPTNATSSGLVIIQTVRMYGTYCTYMYEVGRTRKAVGFLELYSKCITTTTRYECT